MPSDYEIVAQVGMWVHVFSPDKKEDWGQGEIVEVGELFVEGLGLVSQNYPFRIKLTNGRILEGLECWWFPIEMMEETKGGAIEK